MVREEEEKGQGEGQKGGKESQWKQVKTGLTGLHTGRLVCGLPKPGLDTSQSNSDMIIASYMVDVVNSVAFDNCLQAPFYTCSVCCVLITYMDYFHDSVVTVLWSCIPAHGDQSGCQTPACPPHALLITWLTALHACSMVFVDAGARNDARSDRSSQSNRRPYIVSLSYNVTNLPNKQIWSYFYLKIRHLPVNEIRGNRAQV